MPDAPTQQHTPAEAQAELSARLNTIINHLQAQQTNAAPITPAVLAELRDLAADIAKFEPPPPEPPPEDVRSPTTPKPKK